MKSKFLKLVVIYVVIIGLSVLPLFLNSCSHEAETSQNIAMTYSKDHDYKFRWNANPEPDIDHYLVYGWHGDDTTKTPFINNSDTNGYNSYLIDSVPHQFNTVNIRDTIMYSANGDWLHFAVAAVDTLGNVSKIGVSNFLKSDTANR
jgi:hypothetical protein